ncbi:hypothetical protein [Alloactinosynnema sp. L-07]|nr:hypothetical protein [Alloactinosynnema sp. L-07]
MIAGTAVRVRHLDRGWPREVRDALAIAPRPDVLVARDMSQGGRAVASAAGVGWIDGSGAAEFAVGTVVVSRTGDRPRVPVTGPGWTSATNAVVEALLTGTQATVSEVRGRTALSEGAVSKALGVLTKQGLLEADAARGRNSARRVADFDRLLDAYADHVAGQRPSIQVQTGVVWRDPVTDAALLGAAWTAAGTRWAATGALAAAVFAPMQTQVAPLEIYVEGRTIVELIAAGDKAGLVPVPGGRLRLRPFPSAGTAELSAPVDIGLVCVPWPRAYADLRIAGVRGEDAAEHLREEMTRG